MSLEDLFTYATILFALLKVGPVLILLPQKQRLDNMFTDPFAATLYFTSKLSGILAVAFALAAAASAGRRSEALAIAVVLVLAGAATFLTIAGRITGRFKGLADLIHRRRAG